MMNKILKKFCLCLFSGNALWSFSHAAWLRRQDLEVIGHNRNGFNSHCNITRFTAILMRKKNRKNRKKNRKTNQKTSRFPMWSRDIPFFHHKQEQDKNSSPHKFILIFFSFFFTFLHFTTMMNLKIVKDDYKIKYFCMINSDLHSYIKSYIYF